MDSKFQLLCSLSDEELKNKASLTVSRNALLRSLGFSVHDPRLRKKFNERLKALGIVFLSDSHQNRRTYTEEQLKIAVEKGFCWSDVLRQINLEAYGNNLSRVKEAVRKYNISTDHFNLSEAFRRGKKHCLESEILNKNSTVHRSVLRQYVYKRNLVKYECCSCNNKGEWLGQTLILELDHINGNPKDNRLDNLRYLCPNCHSLTGTYRRRKRLMSP